MNPWRVRIAGILALLSVLWCGPWLLLHLNVAHLWLSVPFFVALCLTMTLTVVTLVNEWQRSTPQVIPVATGSEPPVGVLIPTYGEPAWMVGRTVSSVVQQDWPVDRLVIIVSDDARSAEIASEVQRLGVQFPGSKIVYHTPPPRGGAERRGDAKAGNLNSAYDRLVQIVPEIAWVETRDADDEVADQLFLRKVVGLLEQQTGTAYVQTIKTARVSPGDPFNNLEPLFYEEMMLSRHDANAAFPCGSGLVWRRDALDDIGGFPTWSLVEDLLSGIEALKRGWHSAYLPIEGARAQHAPEDLPNVYKQRGTWALDTMRIMFWIRLDGLNRRQKLQFTQMAIYYMHSLATITFMLTISATLFTGIYPFELQGYQAAIRFWPLVISVELFLVALNGNRPFETVWRLREMAVGLSPLFAVACLRALFGGPDHVYSYRVTRKTDIHRWYWKEVLPQTALVTLLFGGLLYHLMSITSWSSFDAGLVYLALLQLLPMSGFLRKSWIGVDLKHSLLRSGATPVDRLPASPNPGD